MLRKYLETTALASMMLASLLPTAAAYANPQGGVVSAGSATITEAGKNLDIHQSTDKAVIDWRSFDIAPDEKTQFYQPNSGSITLNRINSGNPSQILGSLTANGNVVIVNGSGVLFGKDAKVDVNGLVATTSDISNANLMAGNLQFDAPGNANASVINQGTITAKQAGLVGLVAPNVSNSGVITAKLGKVQLESGDRFSLDLYGDGLMNVTASDAVQKQLVENKGRVNAEGGTIVLAAATGAQVVNSLVNIEGELTTASATQKGGKIVISGDTISHTGKIDSSGTTGGSVKITANKIANQGSIQANGTTGNGGAVDVAFGKAYVDNQTTKVTATGTGGEGGTVNVIGDTGSHAFISGNYDVSSSTHKGGTTSITAKAGDLKLFGAHVNADGKTGGGTINVGGEYQGGGALAHAATTGINFATTLSANALDTGTGGNIIVWSDESTKFAGHAFAKGGAIAGDGGLIELSSKDTLQVVSNADTNASATNGRAGRLLLDPKNIIVATGGINGGISSFEFVDPSNAPELFGQVWYTTVLDNGNVLVRDEGDDFMAADAGAVFLFNGATGALISALYGSHAGDHVGQGATQLSVNGNYLINSQQWDDGVHTDVGAVTWFSKTAGVSGVVSAANSLVGSHNNDALGLFNPYALANGNYVVTNYFWDNGVANEAGAVTWGNGTTGISGVVSAANSLVGTHANDKVGIGGVTELTNGNFVTNTLWWGDGVNAELGAATWVNGTTGLTGAVSAANSLIGGHFQDNSTNGGVTALANGNYVVSSFSWQDGVNTNVGAVTWGNGATGTTGVITAANSIVGSNNLDWVGYNGITALANGNYVIGSQYWGGGLIGYGAATWASGTGPSTGVVSAANSFIGSNANDKVGQEIVAVGNNYIVIARQWDNGGAIDAGAVAWGNGTTGTSGVIDATNALVGSTTGDNVGGRVIVANGNYIAITEDWSDGVNASVGAVTYGDGNTGVSGVISSANSIVGSTAGDQVGRDGVIDLQNGNYLIVTSHWNDGVHSSVGAVTWFNGAAGTSGFVSAANSLIGSTDFNDVGSGGIIVLGNGNYLVLSPFWDDGVHTDVGAATWGNGATGTTGIVSAANSLVGSHDNDHIGFYARGFANSNYMVSSTDWDDGVHTDVGAVAWGNGTTGTSGIVSAANSLVGARDNDKIGQDGVQELTDGNYLVSSSYWNDGTHVEVGAITWIDSSNPLTGIVSAANSLVGSYDYDHVNAVGLLFGAGGHYIIENMEIDTATLTDAGAITFFTNGGPITGTLNASNTFFGSVSNSGMMVNDYDSVNHRWVVGTTSSVGNLYSISASGGSLGSYDSYADQSSGTVTLDPAFITALLNAGTAVTLQASNDITINDAISANNGGGNGGALTLQAGRSIFLNDNITTDNGNLNIFANERASTGVVNAYRDAGNAVITMANGVVIDAGTGDVVIRLDTGAGNTNHGAGSITLRDITANTIFARNLNTTGDVILASGALNASASSGDSIILASARNFINSAGAAVLNVTGTSRWLTYSTKPADDVLGGLTASFTRNGCSFGGACSLGAGNGFLYSFDPNVVVAPTAPAVPNTVLYVSQTPADNLVQAPVASNNSGNTTVSPAGSSSSFSGSESKQSYLMTNNDQNGKATYSLFNGWITIAPELVQLLGLDKVQI